MAHLYIRDGATGIVTPFLLGEPIKLSAAQYAAHAIRLAAGHDPWIACNAAGVAELTDFQSGISNRLARSFQNRIDAADRVDDDVSPWRLHLRTEASSGTLRASADTQPVFLEIALAEALLKGALAIVSPAFADRLYQFGTEQGMANPLVELLGVDGVRAATQGLDLGAVVEKLSKPSDQLDNRKTPNEGTGTLAVVSLEGLLDAASSISTELCEPGWLTAWEDFETLVENLDPEVLRAAMGELTKSDLSTHGALQVEGTHFQLRVLGGDVQELAPGMDNFFDGASLGTASAAVATKNPWLAVVGLAAAGGKAMAPDKSFVTIEIREVTSGALVVVNLAIIDMPFGSADTVALRTTDWMNFETHPTTLGEIVQSRIRIDDQAGTFYLVLADISPEHVMGPSGSGVYVDLSSSGLGDGTYSLGGGVGEFFPDHAAARWDVEGLHQVAEATAALAGAGRGLIVSLVEAGYWWLNSDDPPPADSDEGSSLSPDHQDVDHLEAQQADQGQVEDQSSSDAAEGGWLSPSDPAQTFPPTLDASEPTEAPALGEEAASDVAPGVDDPDPPQSWFEQESADLDDHDGICEPAGAFDDIFPLSEHGADSPGHAPDDGLTSSVLDHHGDEIPAPSSNQDDELSRSPIDESTDHDDSSPDTDPDDMKLESDTDEMALDQRDDEPDEDSEDGDEPEDRANDSSRHDAEADVQADQGGGTGQTRITRPARPQRPARPVRVARGG